MFHSDRVWCVSPIASAEELAHKLTQTTWCGCQGFELNGYLFLNDSTSADGAQEYAVLKRDGGNGRPVQIESITFGWCDQPKALAYIRESLTGDYDRSHFVREVEVRLQTPEQHGRCPLCA
jgi:hypothetical protein